MQSKGLIAAMVLALSGWTSGSETTRGADASKPMGIGANLVVVPFSVEGEVGGAVAWFGGLSAELRSGLARIRGIVPAGAATSAQFGGLDPPASVVRDALKEAKTVRGHVGTADGSLMLVVRVEGAAGQAEGWSRSYPIDTNRLAALINRILVDVATVLGVGAPNDSAAGVDGDAYRDYLIALSLLDDGGVAEARRAVAISRRLVPGHSNHAPFLAGARAERVASICG